MSMRDIALGIIATMLLPACAGGSAPSTTQPASRPATRPSTRPAAVRYWVGGSGAFHDAAHWSRTSGGPGGASPPGEHDDAIFDARSGAAAVTIVRAAAVRDLLVRKDVKPGLALQLSTVPLTCRRDCLLLGGTLGQGRRPKSKLTVGRNLDTSGCRWKSKGNLSVHLAGTGWWRYRLGKETKPSIWNFLAAQPGKTTTLRPVGVAPAGIDIDVENQCFFGDKTSLLAADKSETTNKRPTVTLEIHSRKDPLDIVADGCRIKIDSIEHEMHGRKSGLLQHKLTFLGLKVYDVTGAYRAPSGKGPTWTLTGPLDLGGARLSIEKTCVFDTASHALSVGSVHTGASGVGELHVGRGTVTVAGQVGVGSRHFPGRLDLGTGSLKCRTLRIGNPAGVVTGKTGATLEITDALVNDVGAKLDLAQVKRIEKPGGS